MGYDYRTAGSSPVGSIAPLGGPAYDVSDTVAAYVARVPASKVILGVPYYGRAWSTATDRAPRARTSRARSTARRSTVVYATAARLRARVRPQVRRGRGRRLDRLPAPELHDDLRLRDAVAPALLRRRARRSRPSTTSSTATACAASGSGRSATTARRPELYAGARGQVHHRHGPARDQPARHRRPTLLAQRRRPRSTPSTMRLTSTGLVRWGYSVAPVSGTRSASRSATGTMHRAQPVVVHLERHEAAGAASATAATGSRSGPPTPRTTAPTARSTSWSTASRADDPLEPRRVLLARRRRPARLARLSAGPRAAAERHGRHPRRDRRDVVRTLDDSRDAALGRRLDRDGRTAPAVVSPTAATGPRRRRRRAGTGRSATGPVLVDRTIARRPLADRPSTRAASRPARSYDRSAAPPTSTVAIYQRRHARPERSGRTRRQARGHAIAGPGTARPRPARRVTAGTYGVVVTRHQRVRHDGRARTVDVRPDVTSRPVHLPADDDPDPARRSARVDGARRPEPAPGSSCRPTTRPRTSARSRPPSSRRCPARRCSSSTTARPTAPGGSPTSSPAADPRIRVRHRPAKQGLGRAYLDGFARRARGRRRDRRPDGRRLVARSGGPARPHRARSSRARPTSSSARATRAGGGVVDWGLGRRVISRGGSIFARTVLAPRAARPDRRLQGLAGVDARRDPVRRRPRRRLRLPDRDDVPGDRARGAHRRGARSRSATAASASRRCAAGSSSRRSSSSSSCAPRSCAAALAAAAQRSMTRSGDATAARRPGPGPRSAERARAAPAPLARRPGRPRRAAAPGARPRAADRRLPRRPARRLRRGAARRANRSRSSCAATSTTRRPAFEQPRRRRPAAAAADPPAPLRRR